MGHKKRGKAAKAARRAQLMQESAEVEQQSGSVQSFVFHRGPVGKSVKRLVTDLRRVMEPNTASSLKARSRNTLRDFVTIAGPLGVTHFLVLTRSEVSVQLRVLRLPHGPTLTFTVDSYVLGKDVVSAQKHPVVYQQQLLNGPLLVMNGPGTKDNHAKLTQSMFQNLFQPLKVQSVQLRDVKRCVLLNYDADTDSYDFRHYSIKTVPAGVSKSAKKLVKAKLPNLSKYADISDYFQNPGQLSESEYEAENGTNEVESAQQLSSRGCKGEKNKVSIRLSELGPRMSLKLLKIESGVDTGEVLYHAFQNKTPEEIQELSAALHTQRKLKTKRRKQQELNVQKKKAENEKLTMRQKKAAERAKNPPPPPKKPEEGEGAEENHQQRKRKFSEKYNGPSLKRAKKDGRKNGVKTGKKFQRN